MRPYCLAMLDFSEVIDHFQARANKEKVVRFEASEVRQAFVFTDSI
jgi:hypothetical protein